MNFLKPTFLYLLILIPLLLLLYVLKLRRKTHVVSSSLLWEQAIEDMKANTPFQRFRRNLLLPLQIIFLTLAILALARPLWRVTADTAQNIILIIDNSASMQANDGGDTRFQAAKSAAAKMVDDLGGGDRMMIIEAASSIKMLSNFTSDKLLLRNTLSKILPVDASTHLGRAIKLASSMARDAPNSEIFLLSDGAGKSIMPDGVDIPLRFIKFGKGEADNVGITAFEVGQSITQTSEFQVFVELQNFSDTERSLLLELYHNDNLIDVQELSLLSGERRNAIMPILTESGGSIKAVLDVDDALNVDNRAYHILTEHSSLKTLLVSAHNPRLEAAIRTVSTGVELSSEKPETYSTGEGYDVVVLDGYVPDEPSGKNTIFLNPETDLPFGKLTSYNDNPDVIDWDRAHPIMRFVDLSNLRIRRSHNYEMPPWIKPLVESDAGTVIWQGEHDGQRVIILPFETRFHSSNNFTMLAAFPMFMSNALKWLAGADAESSYRQVSPGEPLKLPASSVAVNQTVTIKKPDGTEKVSQVPSNRIVFNNTDRVGIYEVTGDGFVEKFAVNLLDESESDIRPADKIEIAGQEITSSAVSAVSNREIWGSLVLLALVLLAVEWWVYHRRVLV